MSIGIGARGKVNSLNSRLQALTEEELVIIAACFKMEGKVVSVKAYGSGNVHDTFLVTLDSPEERHFILQRMNTRVFHRPEHVMLNLRTCTEYVLERLKEGAVLSAGRSWKVPRVLWTQGDRDHHTDSTGAFWRAVSFIEASRSYDTIRDVRLAKEVGFALGTFQTLICDLSPGALLDTLVGFHVTPLYLHHYDEVSAKHPSGYNSPEMTYGLRFVRERREWAHVLEDARRKGRLFPRPTHGDPKVNNVLIDTVTQQAVSLIDLDTVQPGLVQTDIGDCLRSGCNPLGEETEDWEAVRFDPEFCRAILEGYFETARAFFTRNDYDYLYDAIRLIAFELGLRFLTDHLEGDLYFKARHSEHNLVRALVQFKLTESIESQASAIRGIIRDSMP